MAAAMVVKQSNGAPAMKVILNGSGREKLLLATPEHISDRWSGRHRDHYGDRAHAGTGRKKVQPRADAWRGLIPLPLQLC